MFVSRSGGQVGLGLGTNVPKDVVFGRFRWFSFVWILRPLWVVGQVLLERLFFL